ncbi:ASCH domain-containing protein [Pseudoalteromonas sp. SG41-2]|uniref:ASCH domain-containing protein n=1 Tax=Pseudoalteromonas sp. SG41-2 TaxID=2760978 RepID=UPI001600A753|nr:ASCH domain-containing protein [Pseudoalteromonas sp. SG41-2]MBB1479680.1 ASCH domain-containing protein [Pseudoalteromonas sp. SG41-2]
MKALLSIKPEFVSKIFTGEKIFEYRKAVFKRPMVKTVVIYSTMPVGKIVGEFEIEEIIELPPQDLWYKTSERSGISKEFFDRYFIEKNTAFAIKIKNFIRYEHPVDPYLTYSNFKAPQSFKYID